MPSSLPAKRLALLLVLLAGTATIAPAQVRDLTVRYQNAGPSTDGWSSASAQIRYGFLACDGELWVTMALEPNSVQPSGNYWFQGKSYSPSELPQPDYQYSSYRVVGDVMRPGNVRVGTINYETHKGWGGNCFGAVNFTKVGSLATLIGPQRTKEQTDQYLSSLYLSLRAAPVLTSSTVESHIKYQAQRAAAEAQRLERDRQAQAAQAERDRQAQASQAERDRQTRASQAERDRQTQADQAERDRQARAAAAEQAAQAAVAAAAARKAQEEATVAMVVEGAKLAGSIASDFMAGRREKKEREERAEAARQAERERVRAEQREAEARARETNLANISQLEAGASTPRDFYNVGMAYSRVLPVDVQRMTYWFRRGAEQGHIDSKVALASIYIDAAIFGGQPNYLEASRWLSPIVDIDPTGTAAYHLARVYRFGGSGVAQDSTQAEQLFRKALQGSAFTNQYLREEAEKGAAQMETAARRRARSRDVLTAASLDSGVQRVGARVAGMRFGDTGDNAYAYQTVFDVALARYINVRVDFDIEQLGSKSEGKMVCQKFGPGGGEAFDVASGSILGNWTRFSLSTAGRGWKDPGKWRAGTYEYECFSGGQLIASGSFEVKEFPDVVHPKDLPRANTLFDEGYKAYLDSNYDAGFRQLREAAKMRHATAMRVLAGAYMRGRGVKADTSEALDYYRKASEHGDVIAQFALAGLYERGGRQIRIDSAAALRWYRAAAERGYSSAQYAVGERYELGRGVARDNAEAFRWYRLAARQAHTMAQGKLKSVAESLPFPVIATDFDIQKHRLAQRAPMRQALAAASRDGGVSALGAEVAGIRFFDIGAGDHVPTGSLAFQSTFDANTARYIGIQLQFIFPEAASDTKAKFICQRYGPDGIDPQEVVEANVAKGSTRLIASTGGRGWKAPGNWQTGTHFVDCYSGGQLIAEASFTVQRSQHQLPLDEQFLKADSIYRRMNVDTAPGRREQLLKEAVALRHVEAARVLAASYYMGLNGIAPDTGRAFAVFREASESGNAISQYWLSLMHMNGHATPRDTATAVRWMRAAADQGVAAALDWMAYWYREGIVVERDTTAAIRYHRLAVAQGHTWSALRLAAVHQSRGTPADRQTAAQLYRTVQRLSRDDAEIAEAKKGLLDAEGKR